MTRDVLEERTGEGAEEGGGVTRDVLEERTGGGAEEGGG